MLDLSELSRIGFGCYRISRRVATHRQALILALTRGCTLLDTSSNYAQGESEALIGDVLHDWPNRQPFIVTKAGYMDGEISAHLDRLTPQNAEIVQTRTGSLHSIHPDFLATQIKLSRARLRRSQLDALLLHNPEYYFDSTEADSNEYYVRIQRAFEFLEDTVAQGHIRFYGISSNTFPLSDTLNNATSLSKVLKAAKAVSTNHHCKLIQFPFNFIENEAEKPHGCEPSLIEVAHAHGIVTLGNRPLNANSTNGPVRLATYDDETDQLDEARDQVHLEQFLDAVRQAMMQRRPNEDIMEFVPIQMIAASWASFGSPDMVDLVFESRMHPFLSTLCEGKSDEGVLAACDNLRAIAVLYAKRNMTRKAKLFRRHLIDRGLIREDDNRPFALIACHYYLDAGIDHILVGMRHPKYVESLATLL